ncbi:hypothetical protein V8E53_010669 [Lactarius tabidus]
MPFVDPFTGDTNAGHNATLANTTPAGVNPANPTDTANSAGTTDPVDTADADLLEMLTNDLTGTSLEQDRSTPPLSPTPQGSIAPQAAPTQHSQQDGHHSDTRPPLAIVHFPHGSPGTPVPDAPQGPTPYHSHQELLGAAGWAPFRSQCDWKLAHWAKMHGPSSSAMEELLAIPEVTEKLGLLYSSTKELNHIIDNVLPEQPQFQCRKLIIGGETLELYFRDIISCIRSIYGDPELAQHLITAPEHHYSDQEHTDRVYSEMHTGDWWWSVQTTLESHRPGATVVPIIISSDKTQLTLFRGKSTYPVYLTIRNVPKAIRRKPTRRAQILLGYIPTTKLEGITNKTGRCRAIANLYHSCMQVIVGPISSVGEVGITMMSGDGVWRQCHPILASFVGDYPEQVLVTCTYNKRCPKCQVPPDKLGSHARYPLRDYDQARDAHLLADGDAHAFHAACRKADQKPVFHPFWESLPLSNIFVSITPDILHQLLQGVLKHMGISGLSRVTGKEHKNMSCILLGLVMDLPVPDGQVSPRILAVHSSTSLVRLEDALSRYHSNKDVFIDLGIREHFNMAKIHSLIYYSPSIQLFGTTDNYNTEQTEWLHIELAKKAYNTTNHKDKYNQMTTWQERREKVQVHDSYIKWRQESNEESTQIPAWIGPPCPIARNLKMARKFACKAVLFDDLAYKYGAIDFQDALADFIAQTNNPTASGASLSALAADTLIPFRTVPVHHRIKFTNKDGSEIVDSVLVRPEQKDTRGRLAPSRFDTVLVRGKTASQDFVRRNDGHRIAQVRVVFEIPNRVTKEVFSSPNTTLPEHLAYVEWFSPIPVTPGPNHGLYRVNRLTHQGRRHASIIPVSSILRSVHLFPIFGSLAPRQWNTFSVLELCNNFYINPFSDRDNYLMFS